MDLGAGLSECNWRNAVARLPVETRRSLRVLSTANNERIPGAYAGWSRSRLFSAARYSVRVMSWRCIHLSWRAKSVD